MDTRKQLSINQQPRRSRSSMFAQPSSGDAVRHRSASAVPEISQTKMQKLADLWHVSLSGELRYMRIIMNAVHAHIDVINRDLDAVDVRKNKWHQDWKLLYKIAIQLDNSSRSSAENRLYSVPQDLAQQEMLAERNLSKAEIEWENSKFDYSTEVDRRQAEIIEIQRKITLIENANDMATLTVYDTCPPPATNKPKKSSVCFSFAFGSCRAPSIDLPVDQSLLDIKLKQLREHVLREYQENLIFKTNSLNEFADAAPRKPTHYRDEYDSIRAKITHHRTDFFRCLSKKVMLQCLQLYITSTRTYTRIYNESPITDRKRSDLNPSNDSGTREQKVKLLFRQMIVGMHNTMSLLYCLQPGRVEFSTYLDNFYRINDDGIREALLNGSHTERMLAQVFPDYESPDNSFESPVSTP